MGSLTILLSIFAVAILISGSEAAGSCPLVSKVASCSPKCKENYDCSHGKMCCPNNCNAKSCAEPSHGGGSTDKDKYSQYPRNGTICYRGRRILSIFKKYCRRQDLARLTRRKGKVFRQYSWCANWRRGKC